MASQDVVDKERALLPMHHAKGALFYSASRTALYSEIIGFRVNA